MTKPSLKQRLKAHFAEYGWIAMFTYLALSLLTIIGFSIAIGIGFAPSTRSGLFGTIFAGWLAAKATVPLRILATLALTPLIAVVLQRRKRPEEPEQPEVPDASEAPEAKDA